MLKFRNRLCLLAVIAFAGVTQVFAQEITFQTPVAITQNSSTSSSDILTNGTYVDAVTAGGGDKIGDTTFNQITSATGYSDGKISFSGVADIGGDGIGPASTGDDHYNSVLGQCAYTTGTGTVTLSGLAADHYYQVQVWKARDFSPTRDTQIGKQVLSGAQYTVATFKATGPTASFTFGPATNSTYGEINAIALREVPVPTP